MELATPIMRKAIGVVDAILFAPLVWILSRPARRK